MFIFTHNYWLHARIRNSAKNHFNTGQKPQTSAVEDVGKENNIEGSTQVKKRKCCHFQALVNCILKNSSSLQLGAGIYIVN